MPRLLVELRANAAVAIVAAALVLAASTLSALADTPIMSAPDAYQNVQSGQMILLDIRSPEEWDETGLAQGAWPVSMHTPDFPKLLQAIFQHYQPNEVAMICATGGRTAYVTDILSQNGISGILDVSEGMMGNERGPGWIARQLPLVTAQQATADFEQVLKDWEKEQ